MPRVRFGVVVLVPPPQATEIDGLRRGLGDAVLHRIAPHATLVPPINVAVDEVPAALAVLRAAAATARPFTLELGPPRTFRPGSPTLFLAVDGPSDGVDALGSLRERAMRPPLGREPEREFVPHVTIAIELPPERLAAGVEALADYQCTVTIDALHLLRLDGTPEGARWVLAADALLEPPVVVGRGGIELELTASTVVDPEAIAVLGDELEALRDADGDDIDPQTPMLAGSSPIVLTARRAGQVVGVACAELVVGTGTGRTTAVVVAPDARGQGIGRQLALAIESRIAAT